VLLQRLETLLTRLSSTLNLAEGLTVPKSLKLEPWGGVAILNPDGVWILHAPATWNQVPDATIRWQPEQWAAWVKGAIAGWWSFSIQDGVAVEGDVAWVMDLHRRFRLLPWWWAEKIHHAGPVAEFFHQLAGKAFDHGRTLFRAGGVAFREGLVEDQYAVPRTVSIHTFTAQLEALHEATERLEARCVRLEMKRDSKPGLIGRES